MLQWVVYQQKLAKPLQIQITIGKPYNEFSNQIPDYCQKVISPFSGVMINNIKKEHRQETPNSVGKGFMREQLCGPADIQDSKLRDTEANLICQTKKQDGETATHTLCEPARSKWTCGHITRAILSENSLEKRRRPRP